MRVVAALGGNALRNAANWVTTWGRWSPVERGGLPGPDPERFLQ